jgi:uncharacterized protein (DUF2249 family)
MIINGNTKIAAIVKQHPDALNAIISISKNFEKLRNPLLRKLMAGRTSLVAASRFGNCTVEDFFQKLEPLGFEIDRETKENKQQNATVPEFISALQTDNLVELDVRPVIASGKDPLNIIMEKIKCISNGKVLKIINTFEPTPLIIMLENKGFETYTQQLNPHLVETYFHRLATTKTTQKQQQIPKQDWDTILKKFGNNVREIDVRHLEMPQPMHAILESLTALKEGTALYVYHKRIPVYLLPEISEQGYDYRVKEISPGEVHLLIFKN